MSYQTARRAILQDGEERKTHGGVWPSRVKMSVEVMSKLEEYIDDDCRLTLNNMRNCLKSDPGVDVSKTSVHRALQGMLYSVKKLRIEKASMNNATNKDKRKALVQKLQAHMTQGDMIVYHDESNFSLYLSRSEGWSRIGDRSVVPLPPSQGKNPHIQGGVSSGSGPILLQTHDGSIQQHENCRFVADLFVAALRTEEYRELESHHKIVIVMDNAPAHSCVEGSVHEMMAADGVLNGNKLVVLHLAPYSPMLNPIEGCWSVLKASMMHFMIEKGEHFLLRGEYATFTAHRLALMK